MALTVCGCSRSHPAPEFVQRISGADRLIVTNQFSPNLVVTGRDFQSISQAVMAASEDKKNYKAMFSWHLQFYAGTNFLTARLQGRVFWAGTNQYRDPSGVLENFYQTCVQRSGVSDTNR